MDRSSISRSKTRNGQNGHFRVLSNRIVVCLKQWEHACHFWLKKWIKVSILSSPQSSESKTRNYWKCQKPSRTFATFWSLLRSILGSFYSVLRSFYGYFARFLRLFCPFFTVILPVFTVILPVFTSFTAILRHLRPFYVILRSNTVILRSNTVIFSQIRSYLVILSQIWPISVKYGQYTVNMANTAQ